MPCSTVPSASRNTVLDDSVAFEPSQERVPGPRNASRAEYGFESDGALFGKVFLTSRKCAEDFKDSMRIVFDTVLPKWNYVAVSCSNREVISSAILKHGLSL